MPQILMKTHSRQWITKYTIWFWGFSWLWFIFNELIGTVIFKHTKEGRSVSSTNYRSQTINPPLHFHTGKEKNEWKTLCTIQRNIQKSISNLIFSFRVKEIIFMYVTKSLLPKLSKKMISSKWYGYRYKYSLYWLWTLASTLGWVSLWSPGMKCNGQNAPWK